MRKPVLIILHQEHSTPGRVGQALTALGHPLDIRRPRYGDVLPETLAEHAGVAVFGGPMSANDNDDYLVRETDWLKVPLKEAKPFLGICLGAQMLVRHLGGRVSMHADGHVEIGYYPIRVTDQGRALVDPWPEQVYQWHREGFDLPPGAVLLAEGDTFPVQAFSYGGAAFGLQFHPDVTYAMMCRWTTRGHERMGMPNARSRLQHFEDRFVHDPRGRVWFSAFIDRWLKGAGPAPASTG